MARTPASVRRDGLKFLQFMARFDRFRDDVAQAAAQSANPPFPSLLVVHRDEVAFDVKFCGSHYVIKAFFQPNSGKDAFLEVCIFKIMPGIAGPRYNLKAFGRIDGGEDFIVGKDSYCRFEDWQKVLAFLIGED